MKDRRDSIPMPEYGVCDVVNRIAYIPTRFPEETPEEPLERGRTEADTAIMKIAGMLGRLLAEWEIDGRIEYDDECRVIKAPWLPEEAARGLGRKASSLIQSPSCQPPRQP